MALFPSNGRWLLLLFLCSSCSSLVQVRESHSERPLEDLFDLWNEVVSAHVKPGNLEGVSLNVVDYSGIKNDSNYSAFINGLAKVNTSGLDHDSTYALFVNVYNALAIKMIIEHPCVHPTIGSCHPIASIRDIGSLLHPVWKMPAGLVAGKQWSLDDVEGFLRNPSPLKEDSRLHASIVCASISCPNVRMEVFRPQTVGEQMDSQVKDFLSNNKKGMALNRAENTLTLSPIFLWFAGDFQDYGGVTQFISPYLSSSDADFISKNKPSLKYFDYNWNVNGVPPCSC